jgi:mono/diheme cytochrome c family protein
MVVPGAEKRALWWRSLLIALFVFCALGLLAAVTAPALLAQDVLGPSPVYDPSQVTVPVGPPSARVGQAVYLENCAPCHGDTGDGDGPSASGLGVPVALFSDPATVWALQPGELFHVTKFGRMQAMMPPWSQRLDDATIWNSVAYAWSLHTSQAEVESGEAIYTATCAACHGDTGQGDGPEGAEVTSDFSDPAYAIFRSQAEWDAGWTQAHADVGAELASSDRTAVLEYVRTFSQTPPWVSPYQPGDGVISGSVTQGSAESTATISDTVQLNVFLGFEPVATFTTTLSADDTFVFDDLALDPNLNYIASVASGGASYSSNFMSLSPVTPTVQTEITVFGTTTDATVISIARLHWIVEIEQGALLIGQIYALSNDSDQTFVGTTVNGTETPVTFAMQVPPGAQEIAFDSGALGGRFQQVGPVIYDTLPIAPGQGVRQIIIRYVLPYEGTTADLAQELLYPAAEVSLLVSELEDLNVSATGLQFVSVESMGNLAYQFWSAQDVAPGTLEVTISGLPEPGVDDPRLAARQAASAASAPPSASGTASSSTGSSAGRTTPPPLDPWASAVVAGIVAAAMAGALFYANATGSVKTRSTRADLAALRDTLLDQLAHLDDLHALGDISNNEWMRRRAQLKTQLLDIERRLRGASQAKAQPA